MPVISGQAAKPPVIGPITPVRWRPCTVPAALGTVALIALQDKDDGCWFMAERMYVAKDFDCEGFGARATGGMVRHGSAGRGKARQGTAGHGVAWQGSARQGLYEQKPTERMN